MKKRVFLLVILLGLMSCNQTKHQILAKDSLAIAIIDTAQGQSFAGKLVPKQPIIESPKVDDSTLPTFPTHWSSLSVIPTHWKQVERDEKGYLVYDPCDGDTPSVMIEQGKVIITHQIDEPEVLSIDKFTRVQGNKAFYLRATNQEVSADIQAIIVSAQQRLVLWQIDFAWKGGKPRKWQLKRVMTPAPYVQTFRVVRFACSDVKEADGIKFLPMEY